MLEFVKRYKQSRDGVKRYLGTHIFDEFIETSSEYKSIIGPNMATKQRAMKDEAFEEWTAFMLVKNSDYTKYGSVSKGFISQYSMGNDHYPKTLERATDILSCHRFDETHSAPIAAALRITTAKRTRKQTLLAPKPVLPSAVEALFVTAVANPIISLLTVLRRILFHAISGILTRSRRPTSSCSK